VWFELNAEMENGLATTAHFVRRFREGNSKWFSDSHGKRKNCGGECTRRSRILKTQELDGRHRAMYTFSIRLLVKRLTPELARQLNHPFKSKSACHGWREMGC
jgi:hypothetical protein